MPELRVTVTEKMDKVLEDLVESGLFNSKADLVRFATVAYLNRLGFPRRTEAAEARVKQRQER